MSSFFRISDYFTSSIGNFWAPQKPAEVSPRSNLLGLPAEIWLHIFQYRTSEDPAAAGRLRQVCRDWRSLVDEDLAQTYWALLQRALGSDPIGPQLLLKEMMIEVETEIEEETLKTGDYQSISNRFRRLASKHNEMIDSMKPYYLKDGDNVLFPKERDQSNP